MGLHVHNMGEVDNTPSEQLRSSPTMCALLRFCMLAVLFLGLAGCSGEEAEKPVKSITLPESDVQEFVSASNKLEKTGSFNGATSEEVMHMKACFKALDDGRESLAMRHARELMDSTNAEVRLQAVGVFGWVGKYAISELAEMMGDAAEEVSSEALRQWEMAFDEFSSEAVKMQEIERAAMFLGNQHPLEVVMMKLASIEDYNAVKVLSDIITSTNATPVAAEVAREEYASLAKEPFASKERADQVAVNLKNKAEGISPEPPNEQPSKKQQRSETK